MATIDLLEYSIALVVIGLQVWFFVGTRATILTHQHALPDVSAFRLRETTVERDDLTTVTPGELLDRLGQYEARARAGGMAGRRLMLSHMIRRGELTDPDVYQRLEASTATMTDTAVGQYLADNNLSVSTEQVRLTLLMVSDAGANPTISTIQRAINTYLIRNKGAISDFNLLRDIIQRNLDVVEEDIALTTPIPVYLGLVGTMLGIIVGLFALPDLRSDSFLEGAGISGLLGGVRLAMIASATGLVLTVLTNGWLFKGAKTQVERRKNDFYTFLQTELLPILSQSVNAGVVSLNRSLDVFGATFGQDIDQLNTLMQRNHESMMAQQTALAALKDLDVTTIAQFNVQVLGELRQSLSALEGLAYSLKQADALAANTRALVERTQDVVGLADKIGQVLDGSRSLQLYLNGHFQELEDRGNLIKNTVTSLDQLISREIGGLEQHIQERLRAVQDIKISEDAWMQRAMQENQTALSNLRLLQPLTDSTAANATQQRATNDLLHQLSRQTEQTNTLLTNLLTEQKSRNLGQQIGRLLGRR
jgi:hypothetical protein